MPAPTGADGISRAFSEIAAPSVIVVAAVFLTQEFVGPLAAVLVYTGLTLMISLGLIQAAKYWNIRYTAGFVIAGMVLLFLVPDVLSIIADPLYGTLGNVLTLVVLVLLGRVLADKLDLNELLN